MIFFRFTKTKEMKPIFLILYLFLSTLIFSQEIVSESKVYFENGLAKSIENQYVFTGFVDFQTKVGKRGYIEEFVEGKRIRITDYYYKKGIKKEYFETYFNPDNFRKIKELKLYNSLNSYDEFIYNENEELIEFNFYKDGIIHQHIEYKDGKKHGKWYCIQHDNTICERHYENGKKIKDCK